MAQQRKNRPVAKTPKKRRWLWIPKLMLLMACVGLVLFIGAIFMMEEELRRIGVFGPEAGKAPTHSQVKPAETSEDNHTQVVEEVTPEERKQLEAILQQ